MYISSHYITVKVERFATAWQDEGLTMNIPKVGIPPGYQALACLVDRKALTLRQCVTVGKAILKIVQNLHDRELVQKELLISDVFVKINQSVSTRKLSYDTHHDKPVRSAPWCPLSLI